MSRKTWVLIATIIGSGVVFLDGTVVNLALPHISTDLHASFSDLQWIVDGYMLTLSAFILIGGSLGDILGRKKMYLTGLAGFGIVSLFSGLAPNTEVLIGMRLLQGVFGALLVPGGLAIINTNFPKEERGKAIGTWAAWSGIFAAIGPLLGGWLITIGSWRWIFFINVPLILACYIIAKANVEDSKSPHPRKIDYPGAVLAALSLGALTYGLIEGPVKNWNSAIIFTLAAGAVLMLIFLIFESRSKDPMVQLNLFRSRNFSGTNLMTLTMYGALAGFMFSLVIYLQTKMGYSAIVAGASLFPVSVMLLLFSRQMGGLSARLGPRYFLTFGPLIAGVAMLLLRDYQPGDSYLTFLLPRVLLFSIGLVIFVAPLTATVMSSVADENSGIASGINNAVSRIGGLITIAILGLFGVGHLFKSSLVFCAILAIFAGVISFLLVRNPKAKPRT
jgi:EmrB/QacA subfamily drug resistance transporter